MFPSPHLGGGGRVSIKQLESEGEKVSQLKAEGRNADCRVKSSARLTQRGNYCPPCTS